MQELSKRRIIILLSLAVVLIALMFKNPNAKEKSSYISETGGIFGTTYHIKYKTTDNTSYQDFAEARLKEFDNSLSTFNKNSIISRINQNDSTVRADSYFREMFVCAEKISRITNGAFDITVAPLVNACGFGYEPNRDATQSFRDSIKKSCVGYQRISLAEDGRILKEVPSITLDASAIAKGYGVDVVADLLREKGVEDFMVEIGGEVVTSGVNEAGEVWKIGISRPEDDTLATQYNSLQCVIPLADKALATSGNYLQYYYKDGKRYSHTVDPRTASPVSHSLLSASIIAKDCMTADALATACMVLGVDSAKALISSLENVEGFFIYADEKGEYLTDWTEGFPINE